MDTNQHLWTVRATLTIAALVGVGVLAGCSGNGSSAALPPGTASARPAGSSAASSAAPTASGSPALSPSALLHATMAALRSGGSVHVDIANSSPGGSVVFSDDATASGGRQVITYDNVGHATILLIAGVDYVQANAQALAGFFQLPQDQAKQAAGRWIALRPGDKLGASTYDDVTAGITVSSVADELTLSGALTPTAPATVNGQPVSGVQAPMPASDQLPAAARNVLYVTDNSLHRPVVLEVQGGGSYKYQMSFSQWGEALHLTAPANPVPASAITPATSLT